MKPWISKWFRQLIGQSIFHTTPTAMVIFFGVVFSYLLPAQYAIPLTFIMFIIIGYFLFVTQNGFRCLAD